MLNTFLSSSSSRMFPSSVCETWSSVFSEGSHYNQESTEKAFFSGHHLTTKSRLLDKTNFFFFILNIGTYSRDISSSSESFK